MNFLMNMRISHKISVLMIGLIFGFIVIGVTYYVQIKIENDARAQETLAGTLQNQLTVLNLQQSQLQSLAREVLTGSGEASIDDYNVKYGEIEQSLTAMEAEQSAGVQAARNGTANLSELAQLLQQYDKVLKDSAPGDTGADTSPARDIADAAQRLEQLLTGVEISRVNKDELLDHFTPVRDTETTFIATGQTAYRDLFLERAQQFYATLARLDISEPVRSEFTAALTEYTAAFNQVADNIAKQAAALAALDDLGEKINRNLAAALAGTNASLQTVLTGGSASRQAIQAVVTAIIFAVAIGTAVGVYLLYKSIVFPMVHMQSVIKKINRGNTSTRVKTLTGDELGDLGKAFNKLLDERIQQLEVQSQENDQLNESIIALIQALGSIARKDLTVRVPVSSDITGTVSDAVNLFTKETAKTLTEVRDISQEVNAVSDQLQQQSTLVMQVAENEKRQILATSKALEILAGAMNDVAKESEQANHAATKAIESTQQARQSVVETVSGIRIIRETISETEKRTKRLGDRSQEISGIVNLINTIAERTHILALNASMHAASAGEAGKGFAVVADEVQRLAENARQSTDEIAAMVNNMRVETSDTVNIMNTLISQVAEGSRLAEQAGTQMSVTEEATQELVAIVKTIAEQATQQAEVANRVRDRSTIIRKFSEQAGKQLEEQKHHTDSLKRCADTLVERVSIFTLPTKEHGLSQDVSAAAGNVSRLQAAG